MSKQLTALNKQIAEARAILDAIEIRAAAIDNGQPVEQFNHQEMKACQVLSGKVYHVAEKIEASLSEVVTAHFFK